MGARQLVGTSIPSREARLLAREADKKPSILAKHMPEKAFWPGDWLYNGPHIPFKPWRSKLVTPAAGAFALA